MFVCLPAARQHTDYRRPSSPCASGGAAAGEEALAAQGAPRLKLVGVDRDAPHVIGELLPGEDWQQACRISR